MKSTTIEWFGEWFDSPYYHILYQHRDHEEASAFIDSLVKYLQPSQKDRILDLACGKGRHAIYLNEKGFDVTGIDLSQKNITHAARHENEHLHFYVHDMREVFACQTYDYVLNLFTSFGYFESHEEHLKTIQAATNALKPGGKLLIDFLNPFTVINALVPEEVKVLNGIAFHISKEYVEGYIVKNIVFEDDGKEYHFQEKVKAIRRKEFMDYFEAAGLSLMETFGDYQLGEYQADSSERMIFLLKK